MVTDEIKIIRYAKEEGKKESTRIIATKLLKNGVDFDVILESTDMMKQDLIKLQKEVN